MRNWKFVFVFTLYSNDKVDIFQSRDWNTCRPCGERQKLLALLVIELVINNLPEPMHEFVVWVKGLDVF